MQIAQQRCNYHFINSVQSSLTTLDIKSNKNLMIALEDIKIRLRKNELFLGFAKNKFFYFSA